MDTGLKNTQGNAGDVLMRMKRIIFSRQKRSMEEYAENIIKRQGGQDNERIFYK